MGGHVEQTYPNWKLGKVVQLYKNTFVTSDNFAEYGEQTFSSSTVRNNLVRSIS
jgi:hypothetical protein